MKIIDERLKEAIINNDYDFLNENRYDYDINHRFIDESNDTLLLYALSYPENDIYTFFLDNGADVNLVNDEKEGVFHSIVYSGLPKRLIDLIGRNAQVLDLKNSQTNDGVTPILLSVLLEKYDIFDSLLNLDVDVNLFDIDHNAPIHPSCFLGYKDMVVKLVEKGADLHAKTLKGNYPLALAVNGDHPEIVRYLYDLIYT